MKVLNPGIMISIALRQLSAYLTNPVGYLFVLVYVVATTGYLFFVREDDFFLRNVADLQLLHVFMPWALVVLLPVLGMGAWANEKEHGTDELLLTMPVSLLDAILGKFVAIAAFFSIALGICAITVISLLVWLGNPDMGLMLANFFGWWLLGLIFAACALVASMLVRSQAVAFVFGALICAVVMTLLLLVDFYDPFARGIIPLAGVVLTAVLCIAGLTMAVLIQSSRRWRPGGGGRIAAQLLTVIFCLGIGVNVARMGHVFGADMDVTADGLSSVSQEAKDVLSAVETPVDMVIAVTADRTLPSHLQHRAKEVLDMAQALQRARPDLIRLRVLRPEDRLDEDGSQATEIHGLQPRRVVGQTVVGTEPLDAFLGASIRAAGETATVPYFHPGLSVEYELVRAIRSVSQAASSRDIPEVELTIFMSEEMPEDLQASRQAVVDKMVQIAARDNARVQASLLELGPRPAEGEIDGNWYEMESYGFAPRTISSGALSDDDDPTDAHGESQEVVFAVHAQSGDIERRIRWLGDEEDVSAAIDDIIVQARSRASLTRPVLGILQTDLQLYGGFDPQLGQMPQWEIVREWSEQYEVRQVRPSQLSDEDFDGVDVLVVALPSSLSEQHLQDVYQWVWEGNPTLIMVDPMPVDAIHQGRFLAPVEPRQQPGQQPMPNAEEEKGDIAQFLRGLGLEWTPDEVLWSRYNPSASLRSLPPHFVWMYAERDAISTDSLITAGIDSLLAIYPGVMTPLLGTPESLQVSPLLRPTPDLEWGIHSYHDLFMRHPFPRFAEVGRDIQLHPERARTNPMIAAEVRGRIDHGYGRGSADQAPQAMQAVVIADTDMAASLFFRFYRDVDGEVSDMDMPVLTNLRNVQFLSNAIDVLAGDTAMTSLRGRRPTHRSLMRMEAEFEATQGRVDEVTRQAEQRAEEARAAAQARFDRELAAIDERTDLDRMQKANLKASVQRSAQRRLETEQADIDRQKQREIDAERRVQRQALAADRNHVKLRAIGIPALLLSVLVLGVFASRAARERKDIPASRSRRSS
ncbi:MAG: hypothetical protein EA401_13715 [Planctomycetota bacterium]|nr:MAG: hypothetical protein EA401_13715 [Planctomycetota bacterium]